MKNTYTIRKWNLYQEFYEVEANSYKEALEKLGEGPEEYKTDTKFQDTEGDPELIKTDYGDDDEESFEEGLKEILDKPVPSVAELKKELNKTSSQNPEPKQFNCVKCGLCDKDCDNCDICDTAPNEIKQKE